MQVYVTIPLYGSIELFSINDLVFSQCLVTIYLHTNQIPLLLFQLLSRTDLHNSRFPSVVSGTAADCESGWSMEYLNWSKLDVDFSYCWLNLEG